MVKSQNYMIVKSIDDYAYPDIFLFHQNDIFFTMNHQLNNISLNTFDPFFLNVIIN
jgi:hypothetical protein